MQKFFEENKSKAKTGKILGYTEKAGDIFLKVKLTSFLYNDFPLPKHFLFSSESEMIGNGGEDENKALIVKVKVEKFLLVYADDTEEIKKVYHSTIKKEIEESNKTIKKLRKRKKYLGFNKKRR